MSKNREYEGSYKPQYLYIEQYKIDPKKYKEIEKEDSDDDDRGVIIIDIF